MRMTDCARVKCVCVCVCVCVRVCVCVFADSRSVHGGELSLSDLLVHVETRERRVDGIDGLM
jgi:hypothetical protein